MNKTQGEQEGKEEEEDTFRDAFKYYKRRKPPPDFSRVIDVDKWAWKNKRRVTKTTTKEEQEMKKEKEEEEEIEEHNIPRSWQEDKAIARVGLTPPHTWRVYTFIRHPGLLLVRNPFTRAGQLAWASCCLKDMPRDPNKTNLGSHGIHLKAQTWWELCKSKEGKRTGLLKKLRWVTLGYHHNWDTKEYSDDMRGDMPECVVELCSVVARVLRLCDGGVDGGGDFRSEGDFKAEAAIINYYHSHSTLSPHTDHSEPYVEAPLLSFSFGQSAVFLLGGRSKATPPSALVLHSGDLLIMGGKTRLCYHAVPRIVMRAEWRTWRRRKSKEHEEEEEEEEPWATEVEEGKEDREIGGEKQKEKEEKTWTKVEEGENEEKDIGEGGEDKEEMKNELLWEMETYERKEEDRERSGERVERNEGKENKNELVSKDIKESKGEEVNVSKERLRNQEREKQCEKKLRSAEEYNKESERMEKEKDEEKSGGKKKHNETQEIKKRKVEENKEMEKHKTYQYNKQTNTDGQHTSLKNNTRNDSDLSDMLSFLRTCRINMNIRQVLPPFHHTLHNSISTQDLK